MNWVSLIAIVSIGLMIGAEFTVAVFINPTLSQVDPATSMAVTRKFASRLGRDMPFWYGANLLLLIMEIVLHRREGHLPLLIAAAALWTISILGSILILVPINNRIISDRSGDIAQSQRELSKWDGLHRLRVVLLLAAMVCYLIGIRV